MIINGRIIIIVLSLKGRNLFQVRNINLSYRIRGRVHRIHTKAIAKIDVLKIRNVSERMFSGAVPVNSTTLISLIIKMFVYSAIKIRANDPLLYSVLNPETNSDSPSARSKGVRFVSARFVINQIINSGASIREIHDFIFIDIRFRSMD